MSIMNREKAEYVAHGHSMGFGVQGNELSNGRLVLITEAYAVKHFLLNHQVDRRFDLISTIHLISF